MFNFLGNLIHNIGTAIGGAFISIAFIFGGSATTTTPPAPVEIIATTSQSATVVTTSSTTIPITKQAPVTQPAAQSKQIAIPTPTPQPVAAPSTLKLQIQSVKNSVTKDIAKIAWITSVPARSQLLLDNGNGRGYESINGIGTVHEVDIANPTPSAEYAYKIVAHTDDGKLTDDYYGSFSAVRTFTAHLGSELINKCYPIYVIDSIGKPAVGMTISIWGQTGTYQIPITQLTTDEFGKVDSWPHCEQKIITTLQVTGENLNVTLKP